MRNVLKNSLKTVVVGLLLIASTGISASSQATTLEEAGPDGYIKWRSRICIFGGDMCQVRPQH